MCSMLYLCWTLCVFVTYLLLQALIERHREYTLLYNAECDSLNPKSGETVCLLILISHLMIFLI